MVGEGVGSISRLRCPEPFRVSVVRLDKLSKTMRAGAKNILAVNGGSSSIKFALYGASGPVARHETGEKLLSGRIERIGQDNATLTYTSNRNLKTNSRELKTNSRELKTNSRELKTNSQDLKKEQLPVKASDLSAAGLFLLDWLEKRGDVFPLAAVGHRVVHGGSRTEACAVDEDLLKDLRQLTVYDPDHLPGEIELMQLIRRQYPGLLQIACFDTAFHTTLPAVARMLPIPRRYTRAGIRRYGFHGLSYAYIVTE